jgi:cell division septation protein DedD
MADEGFHEIELKGKQLVFLFMAASVVSVVIFLLGVMVGRGVPPAAAAEETVLTEDASVDPTAVVDPAPTRQPEGAPVSTQEDLSYDDRLEADTPRPEALKPAVEATAHVPEPAVEPIPAEEPPAPPPNPKLDEPAGKGYVVQVMATRTRADAERLAQSLGAKGYPAFVTMSPAATPTPFRVRVGKYNNIREAQSVSTRLEKEEQFKPWVTR